MKIAFHTFQTDHTTTFEELAEFFKDIEKLVKNIYAKIEGIEGVDVLVPVEWDPVNDRQLISEWDGVVVVRANSKLSERERRKVILQGYNEYRKLSKESYPRKHIVRTKTTFLFTVDDLLADTEEKAKWEEYRRKKTAREGSSSDRQDS